MAEEPVTTDQDQGQAEPTPEAPPADDGRDWKKLFADSTRREKELNERLEAIEKAQADKKAEEERKILEAKGEYETILKKEREDRETLEKRYQAEMARRDLKDALRDKGANDKVFLEWAILKYDGTSDGVQEYVDKLSSDEAFSSHFGQQVATGQRAPVHGSPGSRSTAKSLDERLAEADPQAMNEKLKEMMGLS
jgi:hypothetical protein